MRVSTYRGVGTFSLTLDARQWEAHVVAHRGIIGTGYRAGLFFKSWPDPTGGKARAIALYIPTRRFTAWKRVYRHAQVTVTRWPARKGERHAS